MKVVTTANFKAVNDGGDVNPYRVMDNFVRREFPADGGHRLEPIIEESNDDFEDVPDYVEGQNDLQESRGEDDSRIVNESNANDSDTTINLKLVRESNVHDLNTNDQRNQIVPTERPVMKNPKQRVRKEINRDNWGSREERMLRRNQTKDSGLASNEIVDELSCFIDWTTHTSDSYYYSFDEDAYYVFCDEICRSWIQSCDRRCAKEFC